MAGLVDQVDCKVRADILAYTAANTQRAVFHAWWMHTYAV